MDSVFYKYHHKKHYPVTYLFLELFSKSVQNSSEDSTLEDNILPVLSAIGIKLPVEELLLEQIAAEMAEIKDSLPPPGSSDAQAKPRKRVFGKEFIDWFTKLKIHETLFLLSDFDYKKACELYCEVPALAVNKMMETKLQFEWSKVQAGYEGVVYGMGGSIKESNKRDVMDAVPKNPEDEKLRQSKLKNLGFM